MRLLVTGTAFLVLSLPILAQSSETGEGPDDNAPRAQPATMGDPGASQDAEAAREKLLKAANQVDLMETNAESTKASVDGLKTDLTKLQNDNATLKQQVSTLQDTVTKEQEQIDKMQADRAKERQALIDEISALVASKTAAPPHHTHIADDDGNPAPAPKKHVHPAADADADAAATTKPAASLAPPPDASADSADADDSTPAAANSSASSAKPTETPALHKGYYHVVAAHETLSLICQAYRDHGVNVTVAQIRHANGLTSKSSLKVGQKLFIPKPGA